MKDKKKIDIDITERKKHENIQRILFHIPKAVKKSDDLKDLMKSIKTIIDTAIDIKQFYIALYDSKKYILNLACYENDKYNIETLELRKTLIEYVFNTGETLHATEEIQNNLKEKGEIEIVEEQSKVWIGIPLKIEYEVVGVLAIQDYHDPDKYSEKDIQLLEFVSGEIAVAIKMQQSKNQIKKELEEKRVLIDEIHHRVNNNLQVILGLLNLQSNKIKTKKDAIKGFKESQDRIIAMSKVYELVFESEYISDINIAEYIKSISNNLKRNYDKKNKVNIEYYIEKIQLNLEKLVPLGLILNELITNAIKYAFKGKQKGTIRITIKEKGKNYYIIVEDNGIGINKKIDINNPKTFGLSIVCMLTEQIEGEISVNIDEGTKFIIQMPIRKK